MKQQTPSDARPLSKPDYAAAIGRVQRWAADPANASDSFALDVQLLLDRCAKLADMVPEHETLRAEVQRLRADIASYARELSRLRAALAEARANQSAA